MHFYKTRKSPKCCILKEPKKNKQKKQKKNQKTNQTNQNEANETDFGICISTILLYEVLVCWTIEWIFKGTNTATSVACSLCAREVPVMPETRQICQLPFQNNGDVIISGEELRTLAYARCLWFAFDLMVPHLLWRGTGSSEGQSHLFCLLVLSRTSNFF
jgi:hypothetical protein